MNQLATTQPRVVEMEPKLGQDLGPTRKLLQYPTPGSSGCLTLATPGLPVWHLGRLVGGLQFSTVTKYEELLGS